jgi:hypothetical protein
MWVSTTKDILSWWVRSNRSVEVTKCGLLELFEKVHGVEDCGVWAEVFDIDHRQATEEEETIESANARDLYVQSGLWRSCAACPEMDGEFLRSVWPCVFGQ